MPETEPSCRKVFKYKRLKIRVRMILVLTGVWVFGCVAGIHNTGWANTVPWLVGFGLFVLYEAVLLLGGASDIVVDDEGLSRRLYGWVWRRMRWDNMSRIKSFEVFDQRQSLIVTSYNIFPIAKARFRLHPSGVLRFAGIVEGIDDLLEIINRQASKRHILLQAHKGGRITTVSQLTYTTRDPRKTGRGNYS